VVGRGRARGWVVSVREAAWYVLVLRVALSVLAVFVVAGGGVPGPCHFELARNGWKTIPPLEADGPAFLLAGVWQRWDACWYAKIATYGYEPGTNSVAFFPLLPVLMSASGRVLGSVTVAGLAINFIASVAGLAIVHRLVSLDIGRAVASRTILYMLVFPSGFFLLAPFTEALFLMTTAAALYGARRGRWGLALGAAFLAGLVRPPGILLALPLAWEAARTTAAQLHRSRAGRQRTAAMVGGSSGASADDERVTQPSGAIRSWLGLAAAWLAVVAPVVAFSGFVLWSVAATGLSPLQGQDAWGGREFHPPWEVLAASVTWAIDKADPLQALNAAALVGFAVLALLGARRLPASYTLFAASQLLLISIRLQPTPLTSTTRLLLVLFPVYVVLAGFGRRRWFDRAWLVGSAIGLATLAIGFVRGQFIA
jgi:hypothetical protein